MGMNVAKLRGKHSLSPQASSWAHGECLHGVEVISGVFAEPSFGLERVRIGEIGWRETGRQRIDGDDGLR